MAITGVGLAISDEVNDESLAIVLGAAGTDFIWSPTTWAIPPAIVVSIATWKQAKKAAKI